MKTHSKAWSPIAALGVAIATFLFVAIGGAVARETGAADTLTVKRLCSIAIGVVLIVAGNLVPKLRLFHLSGREPAQIIAAERFAGWALVIGGASVAALWLFAPGDLTMIISSIIALAAFAAVTLNWLVVRGAGAAAEPAQERSRADQIKRLALLQILFALCWVFALFLADSLWGDLVSRWMAVAFCFTLPLVAWPLNKLARAP